VKRHDRKHQLDRSTRDRVHLVWGVTCDPTESHVEAVNLGDNSLVPWAEPGAEGLEATAQLYGPDGTSAGDRIVVNTTTLGDHNAPAVAVKDDGNWVAVWAREDDFGWDDVYAQRLDAAGNLVDPPILINVDTYRNQPAPAGSSATGSNAVTPPPGGSAGREIGHVGEQPGGGPLRNSGSFGCPRLIAIGTTGPGSFIALGVGGGRGLPPPRRAISSPPRR